jgi:mono/diheme cytochrome c family protein
LSRWLKRAGLLILGLIVLVVIALAGVWGVSSAAFAKNLDSAVPTTAVDVPMDSATIERGRHIATAITKCIDCHTPGLTGQVMIDDPAFGILTAPNLTSGAGGVIGNYDDAHLARAIRDGVAWDGRPLLFMPSGEYSHLSDADLSAVMAWVRSAEPGNTAWAATKMGPIPRVLFVLGKFPDLIPSRTIDHKAKPAAVSPGVTADYGRYLATVGGCTGCHGPGLSGGPIPGAPPEFPPATNITPTGIGSWSYEDFQRALHEGKRPDGTAINEFMPWRLAGQMTDEEIQALWMYLKTVEPRPSGTR